MVPKDWGGRVYDCSVIHPALGGPLITAPLCEVIFRDGRQQIAPIHLQHIAACAKEQLDHCSVVHAAATILQALRRIWRVVLLQMRLRPRRPLRLAASLTQRASIPTKPTLAPLSRRISRLHYNPHMHPKTYNGLLRRLHQIEAKPKSRKYKSKRLTERTLKPTNMYRVQLAAVANA